MLLLASPATVPQFLSNSTVVSVASAIQDLWSQNVSAALPKAKRKGAGATNVKSKKKVHKTKKKRKQNKESSRKSSSSFGSSSRASKRKVSALASDANAVDTHSYRVERREKELRAGYVPCTLAGCLRTFTSENSMLHHLRDKHNVLDPRLGQKKKKKKTVTISPLDIVESSSKAVANHFASAAPIAPIASLSHDSVGGRLLRLSGWTGGGLGPEGAGIAGAFPAGNTATAATL
jgi:hypothetical protein